MKDSTNFFNIASHMMDKASEIVKNHGFHHDEKHSEQKLLQLNTKNHLHQEIESLRQKRVDAINALVNDGKNRDEIDQSIQEITQELAKKLTINRFVNKIKPSAAYKLLTSDEFVQKALSFDMVETFIISIDIRRSTDLMLKAKNPKLFAKFLVELTSKLKTIILDNYGIYDKFTGDGILAYFPEFYSGEDAGYFAIKSAYECHAEFDKIYQKHYSSFLNVLSDTGLGIGIDYGTIYVDQIDDEHVVVGTPVVYACRLASTKAGTTLLNQQAIDKTKIKYKGFILYEENHIDIKHEGRLLSYKTILSSNPYNAKIPYWED